LKNPVVKKQLKKRWKDKLNELNKELATVEDLDETMFDPSVSVPLPDDILQSKDGHLLLSEMLDLKNDDSMITFKGDAKKLREKLKELFGSKFSDDGKMKREFVDTVNFLVKQVGITNEIERKLLIPLEMELTLAGLKSDLKSREMQKINRSEFTSFKNYKILKNPTPSSYPKHYKKTPTDSDYRIGNIRRSFTRLTNDINAEVFEVSEKDSGNGNPLYLNIDFDWTITGLKEDVIRKNEKVMKEQEKILPGISKLLTPLEYWKPKKGSKDDTVKKLKFIENY
jgi:hypothetical protein